MASSTGQQAKENDPNQSLKLAVAMALLQSKLLNKPNLPSSHSQSDALKWKLKAKERKQEILRLKQDLNQAEDSVQYDLFPQSASCKCYFYDNLGNLSPSRSADGGDRRFNDVLRRRFLRQVRLKERRRRRSDDSTRRQCLSDYNGADETEQLKASVDFLVELCDTVSSIKADDTNFANWSHQAVDFILDALKNLSSRGKDMEPVEGIVSSLIIRLVRRMCPIVHEEETHQFDTDSQFCVQHLIRKLGSEPYVGQRVILSVSQKIYVLAESLLFMDPFNESFPNMHSSMYMLIQLIEFLVSDYLVTWSNSQGFDTGLFEEWATSLLQVRKALELLESRNGLYVLYMDRVVGEVAKQVGQISLLHKLNPDILANLLS